jgi:hypothetical protein
MCFECLLLSDPLIDIISKLGESHKIVKFYSKNGVIVYLPFKQANIELFVIVFLNWRDVISYG